MQLLTKKLLNTYDPPINVTIPNTDFYNLPVKILQFGEGRFIRAFINYFIEIANHNNLFNGRNIVIQPRKADMVEIINGQDGLFTVCSRGLQRGQPKEEFLIISSIKRAIAAKTEWNTVLKLAEIPSIQIITSNTTETGLIYDPSDSIEKNPPDSYPGKLTSLLFHRFQFFEGDKSRGLMILPLELIENNGEILKEAVLKHAKSWNLGEKFILWLEKANQFYKSIVDRIVTGTPKPEELVQFQEKLGYDDKLLNIAELYHSWIIEADEKLQTTIPFNEAGLNVQFVSDIKEYFLRKVRILNGAHTSMVPIAFLSGKTLVKESIEDQLIRIYLDTILTNEIIPFINLSNEELLQYKNTIIERFQNPFLEHKLLTISLYSISKMRVRVLPSIIAFFNYFNKPPPLLPFAFAAFLVFMWIKEKEDNDWFGYRDSEKYQYNDEPESLEIFFNAWKSTDISKKEDVNKMVTSICQNSKLWSIDLTKLPQFVPIIVDHVQNILTYGIYSALQQLLQQNSLIT